MNPNDTGSFGAAGGGMSPELQAYMQRGQNQGGVTQQTTNGSPNAQPMPQPSPMPQGGVPTTGGQAASPERVDDAHIILKAMSERLKSQNKIAEAQVIPPKPPRMLGGM